MATSTEGLPSVQIDFSWIIGEDNRLSHIRLIDRGAAGEVHEVPALLH